MDSLRPYWSLIAGALTALGAAGLAAKGATGFDWAQFAIVACTGVATAIQGWLGTNPWQARAEQDAVQAAYERGRRDSDRPPPIEFDDDLSGTELP